MTNGKKCYKKVGKYVCWATLEQMEKEGFPETMTYELETWRSPNPNPKGFEE